MKLSTITASVLFASFASMTQAAGLVFTVEQIKNDQGTIYLQLFQDEASYKAGKAHTASMVPAQAGNITVSFNALMPGDYAIRYYHDENGDGELQTNLLGIPLEGFGCSNNAKGNFGPATFTQIKVTVGDADTTDTSTIQY